MSIQDDGAEATNSEVEIEALPEGIDDPQVLKAEIAKKDKAIRQIHARAIKAETLLKERTKETIEVTHTPQEQSASFKIDDVVELRLQGYSPKEAQWIMNNGGPKVLEDKDSLVSIAIRAQREQTKAEQAASQTAETSGLSDVERQYTREQLANMSVKELEAILPKV